MFMADKRPIITDGTKDSPTILCLAFNTRTAKEMQAKIKEWEETYNIDLSHIVVMTLNACGHRAWSSTISKRLTVNKDKMKELLRQYINENLKGTDRDDAWSEVSAIRDAIAAAKNKGYIPDGKYEHA